jgi:hypothetical protein
MYLVDAVTLGLSDYFTVTGQADGPGYDQGKVHAVAYESRIVPLPKIFARLPE